MTFSIHIFSPNNNTTARLLRFVRVVPKKALGKNDASLIGFLAEKSKVLAKPNAVFRKGFETSECIAVLSTEIFSSFAEISMCLAVFIDISSACDDVLIEFSSEFLNDYNLPGNSWKQWSSCFQKEVYFFTKTVSIGGIGSATRVWLKDPRSPLYCTTYILQTWKGASAGIWI